jgi:PAS domain S-box-containing protein
MENKKKRSTQMTKSIDRNFFSIFESHHTVILIIAPDSGAIIYANPAAGNFYGYPQDLLSTMLITDINQLPADEVATQYKRAQIEEQTTFVFPHKLANGEIRIVEVDSSPIYLNETVVLLSLIHDITERKQAEAALQLSERRLSYALSGASGSIWEWNLLTNETYYSPRWYEMLGYSSGEFPMHFDSWKQLCHPDDYQSTVDQIQSVLKGKQENGYEVEFRMKHRNGNWVWILGKGNVVERTVKGAPLLLSGTNINISKRKKVEVALRESEARFKVIAETVPAMVCITRIKDSMVLFTNEVNNRAFGQRGEEIIGSKGLDYYCDPADRAKMIDVFKDHGVVDNYRLKVKKNDGTPFWITTSVRSITYNGYPALIGASIDVTEYKELEDRLRSQADILQSISDAVIVTDLSFRITSWNLPAERMYLWSAKEVQGKPINEIMRSVMSDQQRKTVYQAVQEGQAVITEVIQYTKDGRSMVVECHSMPLRDSAGAIQGYVTINRDITERKQVEDRLRESEERFRSVLDNSLDMIYRLNAQSGRFEYISPSAERIIGYTPDELMRLDAEASHAMIHPDDLHAMRSAHARLEETGTASTEYRQRSKDGGYRWLVNSMSLVKDGNGCPLYRDGNIRDITEHKIAEIELHRLYDQTQTDAVTKTQLLNEVNHRVKNNLMMILGLILAEKRRAIKAENGRTHDVWKDFERRIQGLLKVHQMLSDSQWKPINVARLAEQIGVLVIKDGDAKDRRSIGFCVEHTQIEVSPRQAANLAIVFSELITNCLKHAFNNTEDPKITIRCVIEENRLRIEFKDNGCGFPSDVMEEKRSDIGLRLIRQLIEHTLDGEMLFINQKGAVILMFLGMDEKI